MSDPARPDASGARRATGSYARGTTAANQNQLGGLARGAPSVVYGATSPLHAMRECLHATAEHAARGAHRDNVFG